MGTLYHQNTQYNFVQFISAAFEHSVLRVQEIYALENALQSMGRTNHKFPVYTTRSVRMQLKSTVLDKLGHLMSEKYMYNTGQYCMHLFFRIAELESALATSAMVRPIPQGPGYPLPPQQRSRPPSTGPPPPTQQRSRPPSTGPPTGPPPPSQGSNGYT